MATADVLPWLDHGPGLATPRGLSLDYRPSQWPLLRHLIERRLTKAIISARWTAGQSDVPKSGIERHHNLVPLFFWCRASTPTAHAAARSLANPTMWLTPARSPQRTIFQWQKLLSARGVIFNSGQRLR